MIQWIKAHLVELRKNWKIALFGSAITFLCLPFILAIRDLVFRKVLETPDYSLSVYVCSPVATIHGDIIDSTGKKFPVPPAFWPTIFQMVVKNNGARHLDENEFVVLFSKDRREPKIVDKVDLAISGAVVGTRTPVIGDFSASFANNQMRIKAKRLNPNDFIFVEGTTSRPLLVEVFSRSIGLTAHESRGSAGCGYWSENIGNVFVFFRQTETSEKER